MVDVCFRCWRFGSKVSLLSPPPPPPRYVAELTRSPRVLQTRASSSSEAAVAAGVRSASSSLTDVRRTRSAIRAVDQNDRNTRRTSLDGARLRSTSKRCHRRVSRDVVGRTSGSRRRRISGSASVSVTSSARGMLFGRPLDDICQPDLPRPLIQMLSVLYDRGARSSGLFRRSANYSKCQSVKMTLDAGRQTSVNFDELPLAVTAALLKEFLRCLPDCLLTTALYQSWLEISGISDKSESNQQIRKLVECMPASHGRLLRSLMLVLRRVSDNSASNEMTSYNVAACIGQCLLWPPSDLHMSSHAHLTAAKQLNQVVEKMINGAQEIFGFDQLENLLFECSSETKSECNNELSHFRSDEFCVGSSPADSDRFSSTSSTSTVSSCSSLHAKTNYRRRHSCPSMRHNIEAESRQIPKSASDVLCNHHTSGVIDQSVYNSLSDSGCNSIGSETLLDHSEDRARTESTALDDAQQSRGADSWTDDSGCYQHTTMTTHIPVHTDATTATTVRGSTSIPSEPIDIDDWTESKQVPDDVTRKHAAGKDNKSEISCSNPASTVTLRSSKIHANASDNQSDVAETSSSPASGVVKRRGAECPHHQSATDQADGRVATRKLRRTSMMVRPAQHQQQQQADRITRSRRRHSFMLPNGSDVYPTTRFITGFTWPTIVEEDSNDLCMKHKCGDAVEIITKRNSSVADLRAFKATLGQQYKSTDVVESAEPDRAPPSGSAISDSAEERGVVSAESLQALGTKLSGSLQLADAAESAAQAKERKAMISDGFKEGILVDVYGQGRENCHGGTPSPSPPTARRPPSYGEALLHKALRGCANFSQSDAENIATYQQTSLADVCCSDTAHLLMTSSTSGGDVTVMAEIGRPPPPPYRLRPRPQNPHHIGEADTIQHQPAGNIEPVRESEEIVSAGDVAGRQSEPATALVRVINKTDRNELQRPTSLRSPRRRRAAAPPDSAQKENFIRAAANSESPSSGSSAVASKNLVERPSPVRSVDTSEKSPRTCVSLKRRSLRDRDWHRELVNQYTSGRR